MNILEPEEGIKNTPIAAEAPKLPEVVLSQAEDVKESNIKPEIVNNATGQKIAKVEDNGVLNEEKSSLIFEEKNDLVKDEKVLSSSLENKPKEEFEKTLQGEKGKGSFGITGERVTKLDAGSANIENIPTAGEVAKAKEGKKSSVAVMIFVIIVLLAIIGAVVYLMVYRKDLIGL